MRVHVIGVGADFNTGNIPQAHNAAVCRGRHNDFAEIVHWIQKPFGCQRQHNRIVLRAWSGAQRPDRCLHVLRGDSLHHIGAAQPKGGNFFGVKPNAHGMLRAVNVNTPHSVDTQHRIFNGVIGKVWQIQAVISIVGRAQHKHCEHIGKLAWDVDALLGHHLGQLRINLLKAVLHLDSGDIGVGADIKRDGQGIASVIVRGRRHIQHIFHTIDGVFNRNGDRVDQNLRRRSGVGRFNDNLRWRNVGILRHRQNGNGQQPQKNHHNGHDAGKTRPFYKKCWKHYLVSLTAERMFIWSGVSGAIRPSLSTTR